MIKYIPNDRVLKYNGLNFLRFIIAIFTIINHFFLLISCNEIASHAILLNEVKILVGFSFATYDSTICRLQYSQTHTQEYSQVVVVICQKVKRGVTTIVKVRTWYCVVDYNTIKPNHARAEENQVETVLRKFFIYLLRSVSKQTFR